MGVYNLTHNKYLLGKENILFRASCGNTHNYYKPHRFLDVRIKSSFLKCIHSIKEDLWHKKFKRYTSKSLNSELILNFISNSFMGQSYNSSS